MKKEKILYVHQFFFHPKESGGTRVYWNAQELMKAGYEVTVITQGNPMNPFHKSFKKIERRNIDGINVIYIRNAYAMSFSVARRFLAFFLFMVKSTWFVLKERNVSLIIASSTPLSIGLPALVAKIFREIPYIFEVRDLWPEVPIQMGAIRNRFFIWLLRKFEATIYRHARHIVALSPGMAKGIELYIPHSKVSIIPNMSKIDKFFSREKNRVLEAKLGLMSDSIKIIHFGAMGYVNGLENFVEAAKISTSKYGREIEFILVGGGKRKADYQVYQKNENLLNLHIFDRIAMEELSELVNLCDISYIGVVPIPILETNSANKFFDSLSAGKPIIINFGGWMQEIIEGSNCGVRVDATDPNDLLEKIVMLRNNNNLMLEMGNNSRKLAEERFDKSILCAEYVKLVGNFLGK